MVHLGHNVAKLRGIRRLTQKQMAAKLELAQPEYSKIEQKAEIDDNLLELIAAALEIPIEAIRNFNEDAAINIISSTLHDYAGSYYNFPILNFNPMDKLMEMVEDNKKLYDLLLKEKDNLIEMNNKMLEMKDNIIEMYKQQQKNP